MSRTVDDIVIAAFGRLSDAGIETPGSKTPSFARISVRQQELFSYAAQINPEYYTMEAIGVLDAGDIDMRLMLGDSVKEAAAVTKISIQDEGTSPYASGDDVTIVPASEDVSAYLAPRVTIRNHVIWQVGTDLALVTSILVAYSFRADPLAATEDGTTTIELEQPFDELLVMDLARWLVRKHIDLDPAKKTAMLAALKDEEDEAMAKFTAQLQRFLMGRTSRYGHTQGILGG